MKDLRPLDVLLLTLCSFSLALHLFNTPAARAPRPSLPRAQISAPQRWVL